MVHEDGAPTRRGIVASVLGPQCEVMTGDATAKLERAHVERGLRLAVGDEVALRGEGSAARIVERLDRRSALSRPDPHQPGQELVLAANVDVAAIVVSTRNPPLHPRLIDRFLVIVQRGEVAPLICVNKSDLVDADERAEIDATLAPYRTLGVPVLACAAARREGIDAILAEIRGKTSVFVGHSGVGKSSIVAALDPAGDHRVGEVRTADGRGRHTTTRSVLVTLDDGTRIIDTPGIRALGLYQMSREDLRYYFPDLEEIAASCRFRDCSHLVEPGCAIEAAIAAGQLSAVRFETYKRLRESIA